MIADIYRQPGDGEGLLGCAITLANRIQDLRRTRDLRLPRLLSGQVNLTMN